MFTVLTIVASMTLFREKQSVQQVVTEICGFLTIVSGTFLLRASREDGVTETGLLGVRAPSSGGPGRSDGGEDRRLLPEGVVAGGLEPPAGVESALTQRGAAGVSTRPAVIEMTPV